MENLLKSLCHGELNLSKEDEKEVTATKELSEEYNRYYERLINSLNSEKSDQLNILLDIKDEKAVRDEHRFIRYITFGAQLQRERMGDISCSGNVPFSDGGSSGGMEYRSDGLGELAVLSDTGCFPFCAGFGSLGLSCSARFGKKESYRSKNHRD